MLISKTNRLMVKKSLMALIIIFSAVNGFFASYRQDTCRSEVYSRILYLENIVKQQNSNGGKKKII